MARLIRIYDTTLRDGTQGEGISFSMEDKVRLAQRLDALGVHYIEGGWPGSNPKDMRFFRRILDVPLKHARVAAFGATRRAGVTAEADPSLQALVEARTPVVTIFGKSWPFHVTHALQTTLPENLLDDRGLGGVPRPPRRGGRLRRRALLRRVQARPGVRARDAAGGRERRGPVPRALRHERRHAPVGGGRDRARGAAARPDAARDPCPQRRRVRSRELAGGGAGGGRARPGDAQRLRGALRERQPRVDHPEPRAEARAPIDPGREPPRAARPGALRLGAGEPSALAAPAVRRGFRLRAQGRDARLGDPEAPRDVRAHRPRAGGQPPPGSRLGAGREVEHPVEGARVRDRPREGHAGGPPDPRDTEAPRGRGLPVRGRRGVLRAPDGAGARATTAPTSTWRAIASSSRPAGTTGSRSRRRRSGSRSRGSPSTPPRRGTAR